jgi:hypothetical protein
MMVHTNETGTKHQAKNDQRQTNRYKQVSLNCSLVLTGLNNNWDYKRG